MADIVKNVYDNFYTSDIISLSGSQKIFDSLSISAQDTDILQNYYISDIVNESSNINSNINNNTLYSAKILLSEVNNVIEYNSSVLDTAIINFQDSKNANTDSCKLYNSNISVKDSSDSELNITFNSPISKSYLLGEEILFSVSFIKNGIELSYPGKIWYSNIDGIFARNINNFYYNMLSEGNHTIKVYDLNNKELAFVNIVIISKDIPNRANELIMS